LDREKPDASVLDRILQEMKSNRNARVKGRVISFRLVKWAAACLLVLAIGMVVWILKERRPATAIAKTNTPEKRQLQQPGVDSAARNNADVADEHPPVPKRALTRKVTGKRAALFADLHNMQSAASRINAVGALSRLKNANNDVVDALERILNNDPNSNVRLATLDVLARFYSKPYVRKKLAASLKRQRDPVVQIDLISLLIRMREASILAELQSMVNDENTNIAVKDLSYSGMLQLSPNIN
jgi:hypothetical protein